jgi:hypothetical protein
MISTDPRNTNFRSEKKRYGLVWLCFGWSRQEAKEAKELWVLFFLKEPNDFSIMTFVYE